MTYRQISKLTRADIPAGREAEYAALIHKYIIRKNKLIRAFMIAFSAVFAALLIFVFIGRGAELHTDYPAVFWSVIGVLGAAALALAVCVGVNMYGFHKFLKRFGV